MPTETLFNDGLVLLLLIVHFFFTKCNENLKTVCLFKIKETEILFSSSSSLHFILNHRVVVLFILLI